MFATASGRSLRPTGWSDYATRSAPVSAHDAKPNEMPISGQIRKSTDHKPRRGLFFRGAWYHHDHIIMTMDISHGYPGRTIQGKVPSNHGPGGAQSPARHHYQAR